MANIKVKLIENTLIGKREEIVLSNEAEYAEWAIEKAKTIVCAFHTLFSELEAILENVNMNRLEDTDDIVWDIKKVLKYFKGQVSFSCDEDFNLIKPTDQYSELEWAEYTISTVYEEFYKDIKKYDENGFWSDNK